MDLGTKVLGQPVAGEDQGGTTTCSACGHTYGLYGHGVRIDFCRRCERKKAAAGDRDANKRLSRFEKMFQRAKTAQQLADANARQRAGWASPR